MIDTCFFCLNEITDDKEESGYEGYGPDWSHNGDYGCDDNPASGQDGVCSHHTKEEIDAMIKFMHIGPGNKMWNEYFEYMYGPQGIIKATENETFCASNNR